MPTEEKIEREEADTNRTSQVANIHPISDRQNGENDAEEDSRDSFTENDLSLSAESQEQDTANEELRKMLLQNNMLQPKY